MPNPTGFVPSTDWRIKSRKKIAEMVMTKKKELGKAKHKSAQGTYIRLINFNFLLRQAHQNETVFKISMDAIEDEIKTLINTGKPSYRWKFQNNCVDDWNFIFTRFPSFQKTQPSHGVTMTLQTLLNDAYQHWRDLQLEESEIGIFPILWFGDIDAWLASDHKILTVGINPGPSTFTPVNSGKNWWHGCLGPNDYFRPKRQVFGSPNLQSYKEMMARYTKKIAQRTRDKQWFDSYSPILHAIPHAVTVTQQGYLHLDIFSPIATAQKWSNLEINNQPLQHQLQSYGLKLFKQLLKILEPNGIILSIRKDQWRLVQQELCVHKEQTIWRKATNSNNYATYSLAQTQKWNHSSYDKNFWVCFDRKTNFTPFQDSDGSAIGKALCDFIQAK